MKLHPQNPNLAEVSHLRDEVEYMKRDFRNIKRLASVPGQSLRVLDHGQLMEILTQINEIVDVRLSIEGNQ